MHPSSEQQSIFDQFFGAKRWIFNHYLHENKQKFLNKEKHLSHYDCNNNITQLKKAAETSWLRGIDDWCLKNATEDLNTAFTNFFNSVKGKRKGPKLATPKFKSRRDNHQSYRTRGFRLNLDANTIELPKIKKPIKIEAHRSFTGKTKSATITKTPSGKYFVSILVGLIQYKSASAGRTFHQIGRFVPSSKTCSSCGHKLDKLDLGTRSWTCPSCGSKHDRDLNAAVNIKNFGQIDCYDQIIPSADIAEVGEIPMSLQKFANKIERSGVVTPVSDGSRKAARSLVVQ